MFSTHGSKFGPRIATVVLILLLCLAIPDPVGSEVLWLTSDIHGYLVGCDCPDGSSAGLSAISQLLEGRNRDSEILVDLGGLREPDRSDPLLEDYLDRAALHLGYAGLILDTADLRDDRRAMRERGEALPISAAGGLQSGFPLRRIPGRKSVLQVELGSERVAFAADEGVKLLAETSFDFTVWVVREIEIPAEIPDFVDLVVFTGEKSRSLDLETGGARGELYGKTPWISLAPRGNGVARMELAASMDPEIKIIGLKRGESPESAAILRLGDRYMDDLVASALAAAGRTVTKADFEATYWYPFGCRDCEDFLWNDVPDLERRYGLSIGVIEKDSGNPEDFDGLLEELDGIGAALTELPVMIVGGRVLQGDESILHGLEEILAGEDSTAADSPDDRFNPKWEPGAVFLAGLLDGVNPCAFSAMVFLVSALALAGRNRRTMLGIGLFYALGVFITYSLIGAGLLGGLRRIALANQWRLIFEVLLAAFLIVLASLSVIDGIRLSKGRSDLLLKLPDKLSGRVHSLIRRSARTGAASGGAFLLGGSVALIELGCTGQVYLPTIAWMISRGGGENPWQWLILYNLAFILPLLVVFVVSYKGVTSSQMALMFKKRGASVKYVTAALFIVLAVFVFVA